MIKAVTDTENNNRYLLPGWELADETYEGECVFYMSRHGYGYGHIYLWVISDNDDEWSAWMNDSELGTGYKTELEAQKAALTMAYNELRSAWYKIEGDLFG